MSNIVTPLKARTTQLSITTAAPQQSTEKLADAQGRLQFVQAVKEKMDGMGWTLNRACEHIYHLASTASNPLHVLAMQYGKGGKTVSKAQIARWVDAYQRKGMDGLIDSRNGKQRGEYGWELRAMQLYARPQKPSISVVTDALVREGFEEVVYSRVRRYLESLPTDATTHSTGRLGAKEARLNHRSYTHRTTTNLPVGHTYQLDGHTIDVYLSHPQTGKLWRPELTVVMDVASRYIVSYWIGEAENAQNTLFALADGFVRHDHVPAALHLDNGSGFKGKLMNAESTGYYDRFGLSVMFALPGNAKAKGQIERWFGTMERSFGKQWDTYCGADMAQSVLRDIVRNTNRDKYRPPSLAQYMDGLRAWIDDYHHKPHRGLDGKTPTEMWVQLVQVPLEYRPAAIVLPREARKVQRGIITLHGRKYTHPALFHFDGKPMLVEYSVHDDGVVRVLKENEAWVCDAKLIEKEDYKPVSRIEEETQKRLKHQIKRKELHIEEAKRRAGMTLDHEPATQDLLDIEQKQGETNASPKHPLNHDEIVIDLTLWQSRRDEGNNHL
ncbi:MAG: hypothetical protein RI964_825 [Pseudomonadota bacterium]|jgi:putative transposase